MLLNSTEIAGSEHTLHIVASIVNTNRLDVEASWSKRLDTLLSRIGPSEMPVLVRGETGAGKEVVARKLHACSPRKDKPFIKLNCAALPADLIESELFGYEKGAFTGAMKTTPGKFLLADGGTIFLDEIGDMDFRLQAKLLQVLQDGEYIPLGAKQPQKVDVRVIAATHCDLEKAIEDGRFRADLFYRLDVIHVHVPALRCRKNEILPLARCLLEKHAATPDEIPAIPSRLEEALLEYDWPGNVRELENAMRRLLVFQDPALIAQELMDRARNAASGRPLGPVERPEPIEVSAPAPVADEQPQHPHAALAEIKQMRENEEARVILTTLNTTRWNRRRAAQLLNMEYKGLLYRMKKLGLDREVACAV
jgi:transcriptional regulator with PAS, ATPase and Fis domain